MSRGRIGLAGRFRRHPAAVAGLLMLAVIVLGALFADRIAGGGGTIDLDAALRPPSVAHPFGTDPFGRDVLSRVLGGARLSMGVGLVARTVSVLLGLFLGVIAGYAGGRTESIVMRLADITFAFPTLLLLIAVMAVVAPGFLSLTLTLGVVGWAATARLVRAQVLAARSREYVQAARLAGAGHLAVVFRHILPQCLSPVIVVYTLGLGMTIMAESSLSFLGLGVPPPEPSWGRMVSSGIPFMRTAPWLTLFPGLVLTVTVCCFNLVGDGLRDALDPRRTIVDTKGARR